MLNTKKFLLQKYFFSFLIIFIWFNCIIFSKQFQENKKEIHPLLIEVGDFLLDIVKKSALVPLVVPLSYINYVLFKEEHSVIDVVKSKIRKIK